MNNNIPRPEHPNPQWERTTWRNLNGEWEFDFDFGKSARDRELYKKGALSKKIIIPFCPESELSGIGYVDFIQGVCYRKEFMLSREETEKRIVLHFGAVDYRCYVYINKEQVTTHIGGFTSFEVDITKYVAEGNNEIFVICEDDTRNMEQAVGKQSTRYNSNGCCYTRTTGIWQTVWLEFMPKSYIKSAKYYPDSKNGSLTIIGDVSGNGVLKVVASYEGNVVGKSEINATGAFCAHIPLSEIHFWEIGHGRLYDLQIQFEDDVVKSYFGLRNVRIDEKGFLLNDKHVFQRFVLDQGYYPDGVMTAPTDEILKRDITLSKTAGFNGARLHHKVFEPRFLYHCDKEGYPVWSEHGNWGMDYTNVYAVENYVCEWIDVIKRDFNHPSIIGWCPVNETWGYKERECPHRFIETLYRHTKQADSTRPCIAVSGHYHIDSMELYDVHDYCGDAKQFRENYAHIKEGIVNDSVRQREGDVQPYGGQPVFVSEYGGFALIPEGEEGWGYGDNPKTQEELIQKYQDFTNVLIDNPDIMGFCYTQLYDVEQEKNGLYTYERTPKVDMAKIKEVNTQKARIEFDD